VIIVASRAVLGRRGPDAQAITPWYFPSAETYRDRLEAAGFAVDEIAIAGRPAPLPAGLETWLDTFAEDFFAAPPPTDRAAARGEVVMLLRPGLMDEGGTPAYAGAGSGSPITCGCGFAPVAGTECRTKSN
jgi:hypothetical protein